MKSGHESVRFPEPILERIGQLKEATGWSRARVIREFLAAGFDVVFGHPTEGSKEAMLRETVTSAAKWHGSNAAARQLGLFPPTKKGSRGRKKKGK